MKQKSASIQTNQVKKKGKLTAVDLNIMSSEKILDSLYISNSNPSAASQLREKIASISNYLN